jgi:hypothetical protein
MSTSHLSFRRAASTFYHTGVQNAQDFEVFLLKDRTRLTPMYVHGYPHICTHDTQKTFSLNVSGIKLRMYLMYATCYMPCSTNPSSHDRQGMNSSDEIHAAESVQLQSDRASNHVLKPAANSVLRSTDRKEIIRYFEYGDSYPFKSAL